MKRMIMGSEEVGWCRGQDVESSGWMRPPEVITGIGMEMNTVSQMLKSSMNKS